MLQLFGVLKDQTFYLLVTNDNRARIAMQAMSPRMPVQCNVVVGYSHIPCTEAGMGLMRSHVKDEAWPTVVEADSLTPVDWNRIQPCVTPFCNDMSRI